MMQSDLSISSVAGPLLSVSSDFLFHVSSTLPLSFHYPCGLLVLVPRSFETRRERSSCTHAVLFDHFPPKKTGKRFLLSLSVALSYQIDELVGRRKKECWISDLYDRESVDAKNSSVSPFVSTVAGTYIGFAVEQASIWDGSRLFTTGEQKNWRVESRRVVFFDKGPFYLLFLRASNYYLFSRKNSSSHNGIAHRSKGTLCKARVLQ